MITHEKFYEEIEQFKGSEELYHHQLTRKFCYTEGLRWVFKEAKAYWLCDMIASHIPKILKFPDDRFTGELTVHPNGKSAVFEVKPLDSDVIVVSQKIPYTDFPVKSFVFYLFNEPSMITNERQILGFLKSEY